MNLWVVFTLNFGFMFLLVIVIRWSIIILWWIAVSVILIFVSCYLIESEFLFIDHRGVNHIVSSLALKELHLKLFSAFIWSYSCWSTLMMSTLLLEAKCALRWDATISLLITIILISSSLSLWHYIHWLLWRYSWNLRHLWWIINWMIAYWLLLIPHV